MCTTNELVIKIGDKITADIMGQIVSGTITGFGEHKGRDIISIMDSGYNCRFCYHRQVLTINGIKITN